MSPNPHTTGGLKFNKTETFLSKPVLEVNTLASNRNLIDSPINERYF